MRGSITISMTRDDPNAHDNKRYAKTIVIESRGHDECKARGFVEELTDRIEAMIDDIDDLKIGSEEYKI